MLPIINGKSLLNCDEADFNNMLDNPDYRENEFLDYKMNFSFLECPKNDPKRGEHLAEFRSDICAFANASGGYLVYGVRDEKGLAAEIVGIDIIDNNTDHFELDRKNNLNGIMPKMPPIEFKFVPLSNGKYIVVIYVHRDFFAPYVHIENEKNYRIYKRIGNGKISMNYLEVKNMFNQSLSIEKEVRNYRRDRVRYFRELADTEDSKYTRFLLLHIIPDTFTDSSYNKKVFVLESREQLRFGDMFTSVDCNSTSIPNVDGLRFKSYRDEEECRINNDCSIEVFQSLCEYLNIGYIDAKKYPKGYLASSAVWDRIEPVVFNYIAKMKGILVTKRVFVCLSIVGCKGAITDNNAMHFYNGKIDRDIMFCEPIAFENIADDSSVERLMKQVHLEFLLALGVRYSDAVKRLLNEVYEC